MATRSTIALEYADGSVGQVYCHWDGYLDHNGAILLEHYKDPFKLRDLIDLGDLSSLDSDIGGCSFYGRDRGDDGCAARRYKNFDEYETEHQYEEFEYILRRDGVWYVSDHGERYIPLFDAIEIQRAEEEV